MQDTKRWRVEGKRCWVLKFLKGAYDHNMTHTCFSQLPFTVYLLAFTFSVHGEKKEKGQIFPGICFCDCSYRIALRCVHRRDVVAKQADAAGEVRCVRHLSASQLCDPWH